LEANCEAGQGYLKHLLQIHYKDDPQLQSHFTKQELRMFNQKSFKKTFMETEPVDALIQHPNSELSDVLPVAPLHGNILLMNTFAGFGVKLLHPPHPPPRHSVMDAQTES
jgi:hypothetical protein